MKIDLLSLFYLFAVLQSLVFLYGINIEKPFKGTVKKVTSLLLLAVAIVMLYYVAGVAEIWTLYKYIFSIGSAAWMALCPLLFLFCRAIIEPSYSLSWRDLIYFPLSLIFLVEGIVTAFGWKLWLFTFWENQSSYLDFWMVYFFGTGIYFTFRCVRILQANSGFIFKKELSIFTKILFGLLICFACIYMIIRHTYTAAFEYTLVSLLAFMVFILLYKTIRVANVRRFFDILKPQLTQQTSKDFMAMAHKLETVMQTAQPFLDQKLTLTKLAKLTDISEHNLSKLLNAHFQKRYYDYINEYRIQYLASLLAEGKHHHYTIISLAEQSGFNSKATFYKAFRDRYNTTPSQYIKAHF